MLNEFNFKPFKDFNNINDGYSNTLVQACVTRIATVYSEPRFVEKELGEPVENSLLTNLLDKPNPLQSGAMLRKAIAEDVALYGNAYLHLERTTTGRILSIELLDPEGVTPLVDRTNNVVVGYQYTSAKGIVNYAKREVVHLTWFITDPVNRYMGLPPMFGATKAIETYNEIQRHVAGTMYRNGMSPMYAITKDPNTAFALEPKGTVENVVDTIKKAWKRSTGRLFGGRIDSHDDAPIITLAQGQDIKPLGFDIKSLEAPILLRQMETQICSAFCVPPELAITTAGIENSTYNNLLVSTRNFIQMTMKPLWILHGEQLSVQLADVLGGKYIETNFNEVSALEPTRNEEITAYSTAFTQGVVTTDEYRATMGLPPLEQPIQAPVQLELTKSIDSEFFSIENMDYYSKALDVMDSLEGEFAKAHNKAGTETIKAIEEELKLRYPSGDNVDLSTGVDAIGVDKFKDEYILAIEKQIPKLTNQVIEWSSVQVDYTPSQADIDEMVNDFRAVITGTAGDSAATIFAKLKSFATTVPSSDISDVIKALRGQGLDGITSNVTVSSRTLATRLTNETSVETWKRKDKQLRKDGKKIVKVWFTQRDSRVRPAHKLMEGTTIDVGSTFSYQPVDKDGIPIGEPQPMNYPADITEENVGEGANCRCVLRPRTVSI